jgi:hypothetical protein
MRWLDALGIHQPDLSAVLLMSIRLNSPTSTPVDLVASSGRETLSDLSDPTRIDRRFGRMLIPAVLVAAPLAILLFLVLRTTNGHFTYTLDDPYIHLALARNIWHGHYGINGSEFSAPSSSILWPFLLAPFSASGRLFEYAPLALNFMCLWATIGVMCRIFRDLPVVSRVLVVGSIAISLNLYGLVFIGMEHSLQILLVTVVMLPLIYRDSEGGIGIKVPNYVFAALIALPLTRYEGLAISLPVLLFLFVHGYRKAAVLLITIIALTVGSFSAFLHVNGLNYLPSSVLAKTDLGGIPGIAYNLHENLQAYGFILLPVAWVLGVYWQTSRSRCFVVLAATVFHFVFGHFGWFGRYEVYYILFIVVLSVRLAVDSGLKMIPAILCLPFVFQSLIVATLYTPQAAENIYGQQAQMARITAMLGAPIAVNDLGLVALRSGQYTLDLWGLGSIEALRNRLRGGDSEWIAALMARKHAQYAFVYDAWFPHKPASWIRVGELKLLQKKITPYSDLVSLYAVDPSSAAKLRSTLRSFAQQNVSQDFSVAIY